MLKEKYFLAGLKLPNDDVNRIEDSMLELEGLVKTAGGEVVGSIVQNRPTVDPAYYIGKGKWEEIHILFDIPEGEQGCVVVNASLSPAQARNIEEILECRVITRTELILDIFAIHAHSQVAKLQVETAQLKYLLPRLVGLGNSLSRTGGGIGTRGPGETKLETDRRKIHNRIALLKKELKHLEKSAQERRKSREDVFKVAIAGYTNAGKSSISSRLTKENLHAEDKLFSTIDTTTRRLALGGINAVLTDTVGFIRDIPHDLVESFRSTLAETAYANLVIHAVDLSSKFYQEKIKTADDLMDQIGVESPVMLVFNKIDLVSPEVVLQAKLDYPNAFFVSAKNEQGIEDIKKYLKQEALVFFQNNGTSIPEWQNFS